MNLFPVVLLIFGTFQRCTAFVPVQISPTSAQPRIPIVSTISKPKKHRTWLSFSSLASTTVQQQATELPDSLDDAAARAALASAEFCEAAGSTAVRCRVDFDTTIGDETYTLLKASTEFMQKFVSALCYAIIPGLQAQRQEEIMRVVAARAELRNLQQEAEASGQSLDETKQDELLQIIARDGRNENYEWTGPIARIYFPDEGSAALARRDWTNAKVPPCVEFSSCGGVQTRSLERDQVVFFFCPKASECDAVEKALLKSELEAPNLKLTVFVNPNLVDMGVTGFGMAGRLLRERLIDGLQYTYYLRTLSWGALTRQWPLAYSVWQEDDNQDGGYRLIRTLDRLPSNPEVEDIYDEENGNGGGNRGGGVLDQLGDFMNGMMRL